MDTRCIGAGQADMNVAGHVRKQARSGNSLTALQSGECPMSYMSISNLVSSM